MWTHRSPYCPHFTYGPWGRLQTAPNREALGCLLEVALCLQLEFQAGNDAITGFFPPFQVIIQMSWGHRTLDSEPLRTRAIWENISTKARLNGWAPQTRGAGGLGFGAIFMRNSYTHVGFSPPPSRHWGCNPNLIQPKANLLAVFLFFIGKKLEHRVGQLEIHLWGYWNCPENF